MSEKENQCKQSTTSNPQKPLSIDKAGIQDSPFSNTSFFLPPKTSLDMDTTKDPNQFIDWETIVRNETRAFLEQKGPLYAGKDILTAEETMELMSLSRGTLYNLEKDGTLNPRRLGRRVYYLRSDIYKALESSEADSSRQRTPQKGKN